MRSIVDFFSLPMSSVHPHPKFWNHLPSDPAYKPETMGATERLDELRVLIPFTTLLAAIRSGAGMTRDGLLDIEGNLSRIP